MINTNPAQLDIFGFSAAQTQQLLEQKVRGLPHSVQRLIAIWGYVTTYEFLIKNGGTRMHIPAVFSSRCRLVKQLTEQQFKALIAEFKPQGQFIIEFPKSDKMLNSIRNQAICEEKQQGKTLNELAIKYNLTSRHIINIVKK